MAFIEPSPTNPAFSEAALDVARKQPAYNRRIIAWSWYDWADHAYITTTASAFFPPYFVAIAAPAFLAVSQAASQPAQALARDAASNLYASTVSLALFSAAIIAPILGAYADIAGRRKRLLIVATAVGALFAGLMFILTTGMWLIGLALYYVTQVALNIALGLNSSLLPHLAHPDDVSRASSLAYAMGYAGGGLLLALDTALYLFAGKLGIDSSLAVRIAFMSVGVWWLVFALPVALRVPEPVPTPLQGGRGVPLLDAITRLGRTLRDANRYQELFKMLLAFWLYSEGIGAIILLATAYGAALGLSTAVLVATLLMTQFVAFPYALLYSRIPDPASQWRGAFTFLLLWTAITLPLAGILARIEGYTAVLATLLLIATDQVLGISMAYMFGRQLLSGFVRSLSAKRTIILGLSIYAIIPIWGFFLRSQSEFFMIGWLVGTVQGGTQALSRAVYANLTPQWKSGEFFGLYGLSEKFAGILGPLLYAVVGEVTHSPRASVLSASAFFLAGIVLLWHVNEQLGTQIAQAENAQIQRNRASD